MYPTHGPVVISSSPSASRVPLQAISPNVQPLPTMLGGANGAAKSTPPGDSTTTATSCLPAAPPTTMPLPLPSPPPAEVHISKWQRIDSAGRPLRQASALDAPSPSPSATPPASHATSAAPAFDYFAAARRAAAVACDDGRVSLIPDLPGHRIEASQAPSPRTAFELKRQPRVRLSLGDEWLDAPLQGGIGEGITELVGEAACGKTQIAMQLLLQAQLPVARGGLAGGSLFLSMEGEFPINRLRSLAEAFKRRHPELAQTDVLGRVFIKVVNSPGELWSVLSQSLRLSLESGEVKFVVLDSVAAMFRAEQNANAKDQDLGERSQDLMRMAAQLKQYSATYHVPVLIINQVTDFFAGADSNNGQALRMQDVKHSYMHHWSMESSGRRVLPALGLTWANCVNTRIFLTRKHEFVLNGTSDLMAQPRLLPKLPPSVPPSIDTHGVTPLINMFTGGSASSNAYNAAVLRAPLTQDAMFTPPPTRMRRFLHVQFAPHLPPGTAEFIIEMAGIRGLQPQAEQTAPSSPPSLNSSQSSAGQPSASSYPNVRSYAPAVPFLPSMPMQHPSPPPAPPSVTAFPFVRNMFTPSGGANASYFDDDEMTPSQEAREAEALAEAEAAMTQARRDTPTKPGPPILNPIAILTSPQIFAGAQ